MIQTLATNPETTRGLIAGEIKYDTYFTLFCSLLCAARTCASNISVQSRSPFLAYSSVCNIRMHVATVGSDKGKQGSVDQG